MYKFFMSEANPHIARLLECAGFEQVYSPWKAHFLQFVGGADVNPLTYGSLPHESSQVSEEDDGRELALAMYGIINKIPMAGICRGGQLLNIMNGGSMIQDVRGHTQEHPMLVKSTGELMLVTSTHHQMMVPTDKGEVLATATVGEDKMITTKSGSYYMVDEEEDVEVVFYPATKSLCFQPHPEWAIGSPFANYYLHLIKLMLRGAL